MCHLRVAFVKLVRLSRQLRIPFHSRFRDTTLTDRYDTPLSHSFLILVDLYQLVFHLYFLPSLHLSLTSVF